MYCRRSLGYELRKGDYMFNNFSLSKVEKMENETESSDNIVMVHTSEQPPPMPSSDNNQRWRVRRRSSSELRPLDTDHGTMSSSPRVGRTNSVLYAGAEDDTEYDSCFSDSSEASEGETEDYRRHSMPTLHPMADLEMVKYLVRPPSSRSLNNPNVSENQQKQKLTILHFRWNKHIGFIANH